MAEPDTDKYKHKWDRYIYKWDRHKYKSDRYKYKYFVIVILSSITLNSATWETTMGYLMEISWMPGH